MTKTFLAAASALALMTGVAAAQNAAQDTQVPPAGQQEQAKPSTDQMNTGAAAGAGQSTTGAAQQSDSTAGQSTDTAEKPAEPAAPSTDTAEKPGGMESPTTDTAQKPDMTATPSTDAAATPDTASTPSTDRAGAEATDTEKAIEKADASTDTDAVSGPSISMRDMMGQSVLGSDGESIGDVYDLVVDSGTGQIKQVVISSGGFLGLGEKQVVVDYEDLEVQPGSGVAASDLTRESIEGMEEYDVSSMTESLDAEAPPPATGGGMGTPAPAPAPAQ